MLSLANNASKTRACKSKAPAAFRSYKDSLINSLLIPKVYRVFALQECLQEDNTASTPLFSVNADLPKRVAGYSISGIQKPTAFGMSCVYSHAIACKKQAGKYS